MKCDGNAVWFDGETGTQFGRSSDKIVIAGGNLGTTANRDREEITVFITSN